MKGTLFSFKSSMVTSRATSPRGVKLFCCWADGSSPRVRLMTLASPSGGDQGAKDDTLDVLVRLCDDWRLFLMPSNHFSLT